MTGCGDRLLERSYSSVTPHSAAYRVEEEEDTLRAENYQELINALLILLGDHSAEGVVRIYGEHADPSAMAGAACVEVQQETALGAYLLDYMTYDGTAESGWYELTVRFGYRRTAEAQAAIVNATSTEALPDLLRAAIDEERDSIAIRFGYFATDRAGVMEAVASVHDEVYPPESEEAPVENIEPAAEPVEELPESEAAEAAAPLDPPPEGAEPPNDSMASHVPPEPVYDFAPWQVLCYPDTDHPGIVEVILHE